MLNQSENLESGGKVKERKKKKEKGKKEKKENIIVMKLIITPVRLTPLAIESTVDTQAVYLILLIRHCPLLSCSRASGGPPFLLLFLPS